MRYMIFVIYVLLILIILLLLRIRTIDNFVAKILCDYTIPPENERNIVYPPLKIDPSKDTNLFQKIPRIIMQTNEKDMVPEKMAQCFEKIISLNPEYKYLYFSNETARSYIENNYPKRIVNAYDKLKPGAYKADLFRYCFLYKNGGVYIDSPMIEIIPLRELIRPEDNFISPEDDNTTGLYNAFICCSPLHPIIKESINISVYNIENDIYGDQPLFTTGPTLFSRAFKNITGKGVQANKEYANNIRVIKYIRTGICDTSGEISSNNEVFFITRYPTYKIDSSWYNTGKHYSSMWREKNIFNTKSELKFQKHQRHLINLLEIFIDFAEKNDIKWWATGGTLLGAVREKNIIKWDDDVDLELPTESIDTLLSKTDELESLGVKIIYNDKIYRFKYINEHEIDPYIDLFQVEKQNDIWKFTEPYNIKRWPNSYFKDEELHPIKEYKFGRLNIKGPNNPIPYLERQYKNWKVPVQDKGHHKF